KYYTPRFTANVNHGPERFPTTYKTDYTGKNIERGFGIRVPNWKKEYDLSQLNDGSGGPDSGSNGSGSGSGGRDAWGDGNGGQGQGDTGDLNGSDGIIGTREPWSVNPNGPGLPGLNKPEVKNRGGDDTLKKKVRGRQKGNVPYAKECSPGLPREFMTSKFIHLGPRLETEYQEEYQDPQSPRLDGTEGSLLPPLDGTKKGITANDPMTIYQSDISDPAWNRLVGLRDILMKQPGGMKWFGKVKDKPISLEEWKARGIPQDILDNKELMAKWLKLCSDIPESIYQTDYSDPAGDRLKAMEGVPMFNDIRGGPREYESRDATDPEIIRTLKERIVPLKWRETEYQYSYEDPHNPHH
ncbi:MAG: hypothetical protein EZS28_050272, partial [Streblomastix strix]